MTDLRIIHSSMQFSDTKAQHLHDADAIFKYADKRNALLLTGTEAGGGGNHDLRDALLAAAKKYGWKINAHKWGDWCAVNLDLAKFADSGYEGPFVKGTTGLKASQGAHSPRGITWLTATVDTIGTLTIGSAHYLTARSQKVSGSNAPLVAGIAAWGKDHGKGKALCFFGADINQDDEHQDPFKGGPFTSCWDELGNYPGTHSMRGPTIDVIASYNGDGRVSCKSARRLDDTALPLFTDHFAIEATYAVKDLPAKK